MKIQDYNVHVKLWHPDYESKHVIYSRKKFLELNELPYRYFGYYICTPDGIPYTEAYGESYFDNAVYEHVAKLVRIT